MSQFECRKCRWWTPWRAGYGICKGAPPIKGAVERAPKEWDAAQWPLTQAFDYCGVFTLGGTIIEQSEMLDGKLAQTVQFEDGREFIHFADSGNASSTRKA